MRKKVTMRMEAGLRMSVAGVMSSIRMKKTKNWLGISEELVEESPNVQSHRQLLLRANGSAR